MGQAIGGLLPLAVGIALSPVPIIAVVLMLTSRRAKVNGPAFVVGWLIGLGIVGAIVLAVAGTGGASKHGTPATWLSWVKIALGVLLLLVPARQFRSRPHGAEEPQMPKWMATIDRTTPAGALGLAAVLSGANPKNLLLAATSRNVKTPGGGYVQALSLGRPTARRPGPASRRRLLRGEA